MIVAAPAPAAPGGRVDLGYHALFFAPMRERVSATPLAERAHTKGMNTMMTTNTLPARAAPAALLTWAGTLLAPTARAEAASRLSVASAAGPSRRFRHRLRFAALILAQAAAVLVGVLLLTQDRVRAHTLVALNETVPKVIDIEPSEVLVLRSKAASAQLERLEFEELRLSDTETVSLDTSLLAYFEAREGN